MTADYEWLIKKAAHLRRDVAAMIGPEKTGHLGGACSLADIVTALYYRVMRIDPARPDWPERDRCILSKGHAALIQYAALGDLNYFPKEWEKTVKQLGSPLQGHPDLRKVPGIEANTGSLGQGLSIAAGMAAGLKRGSSAARVYCLIGDGEQAEGQIWEAAMAASAFKLNNLVAVVDANGLQATGEVAQRFDTRPHAAKWEAFGWQVIPIDGHDMGAILSGFERALAQIERPTVLIAKTVKGKGFSFAENAVAFHNGMMTKEQYDLTQREVW